MRTVKLALIASLVLSATATITRGGDDKPADPDEALLQEAKVGTDGAALLDYVRKNTGSDDDLLKLDKLVQQLGSDELKEREEASAKLVKLGLVALPSLRKAKESGDAEVKQRATEGVEQIVKQYRLGLPLAAMRKLLQVNPDGTVEALVRYLPYAGDEAVEEEIYFGVYDLTKAKKSVDPALKAALTDKLPSRRALAACVTGRLGDSDQRKEARRLLHDADTTVRLRAAQGLLAAKDKESLPTLVGLLESRPLSVAWQAEELLHWAAGSDGPETLLGAGGPKAQAACRKAWDAWLGENAEKLDLSLVEDSHRRPGLFLVCSWYRGARPAGSHDHNPGIVYMIGCDGKPRWRMTNVIMPVDAHLMPDDRILIAETDGADGVSTRSLDGQVLWAKQLDEVVEACTPLPTGKIFVAHGKATELTTDGDVVYSRSFTCTVRGRNEKMRCDQRLFLNRVVTTLNELGGITALAEFDATNGSQLRKTSIQPKGVGNRFRVEPLSTGGYLISGWEWAYEVDIAGATVWSVSIPKLDQAIRMRTGNTLVLYGETLNQRLIEISPDQDVLLETSIAERADVLNNCLGILRVGFDASRTPLRKLKNRK
jgi:hypothetical protein